MAHVLLLFGVHRGDAEAIMQELDLNEDGRLSFKEVGRDYSRAVISNEWWISNCG